MGYIYIMAEIARGSKGKWLFQGVRADSAVQPLHPLLYPYYTLRRPSARPRAFWHTRPAPPRALPPVCPPIHAIFGLRNSSPFACRWREFSEYNLRALAEAKAARAKAEIAQADSQKQAHTDIPE